MKIEFLLAALPLWGAAPAAPKAAHSFGEGAEVALAEALLKKSDELLASAQTLQATYVDTAIYTKPYRDLRQTGTVTLSKPGSLRIAIVRARRVNASEPWADTGNDTLRVSDATNQYSVFFHPHSTQVRKLPRVPAPSVNEAPILSGFFGGRASPLAVFESAKDSGTLGAVQANNTHLSFVVGSIERQVDIGADGLVHRLVEKTDGAGNSRTFELQAINIGEPVSPTAFTYAPPSDALPYERTEALDALEPGADAPEISASNTKGTTVKLSDFRGKVVVLKFWATWCWPCNQSLPETESIAAKYQSDGVETLAVAIKDSRQGFDAWLAKHPQFGHIRFLFEDPIRGDASRTYRVSATPTVYVIGRDGRIVTEFDGYAGPNPRLEEAIKGALAR